MRWSVLSCIFQADSKSLVLLVVRTLLHISRLAIEVLSLWQFRNSVNLAERVWFGCFICVFLSETCRLPSRRLTLLAL